MLILHDLIEAARDSTDEDSSDAFGTEDEFDEDDLEVFLF